MDELTDKLDRQVLRYKERAMTAHSAPTHVLASFDADDAGDYAA
ncbi:MAG TPA: hypothetical protein VHV99_13065 [Paraburkholderia sp.]|nr:hypothetical protein [Paraburkholderia sp.]